MRAGTVVLFMLPLCLAASAPAAAQTPIQYVPTPRDLCFTLGSLRVGSDSGSLASPAPHELTPRLAEGIAACETAVAERPQEGRLYARLARLKLLAGDAQGGLDAARKGVEYKSESAQTILGVLLADGKHAPRDYTAARELFRLSARNGVPYANYNLGVMHANGWSVPQSDADAANAFRLAALGGDALAMQLMGARYDTAQAEMWFRRAAEQMYPEPGPIGMRIAEPGRVALDGNALYAWYEQKAKAGEPWAIAYVGMLHESGTWVAQDYRAAAQWYKRADDANTAAMMRLARLYREGLGVPKDPGWQRAWNDRQQARRCEALENAEPQANLCDRLAAERYDPQKTVAGVDSYCMRVFAERAVTACSQALKRSPGTVRYRTQLARALAHSGRFAEARREAGGAAAAGSTSAMVLLGVLHQRGLGGPTDPDKAGDLYRKAAEGGDLRGAALANLPISTVGPSLREQAERGDLRAQHSLAGELEREQKYDEAILWYTRAAEKGYRISAMNLAQMYEKGIGVKADTAEAMRRYRLLSDQGDGESRYRLAVLSVQERRYDEAVKLFTRSIQDDDYRAMLGLAELYEHGHGVPRDMKRALAFYERGAAQSGWARFKAGVIHLQGAEGVSRDYAKAREWLTRSAADGNPGARNNLGVIYDRGLGVTPDPAAAREHWIAAVRGQNPQAKGNLERFYAEGRGVPAGAAAVQWYREGAEVGISHAQYRLGLLYARGEHVARNDTEALVWLRRAAEQGHADARREAAAAHFRLGQYMEAALLGHEGALAALAAKLVAEGKAAAVPEVTMKIRAMSERQPPVPTWPEGISTDPGEDKQRAMQVRVAAVPVPQAAARDAAIGNVYDIVRWFPETDGKKK